MDQQRLDDESIFRVARKIEDPAARAAYLDRACGADRGLRGEVDALLSAHDREQSFLEAPAVPGDATSTAAWSAPAERPGAAIGPYRLLEQIGEGGMGTVFMAEQVEPVRRKVALKIIKPGMDTKQVIARFEAERQALALMDHPNIARVLDAGATDSGRPYFVMELVRGLPVTEYCDRERLPIRDRLGLFVLVCRAVQHAHQKGVIHRDLKPSNVLVTVIDGDAVPKVIDFGVAKATGASLTDRTLFTGFHQMIGTPLYMSPEQADVSGVDVDTRSDIYSLGVLLYELLTGTTPLDRETFARAALDEMRRVIREEEPPTPSTRLGALGETLTTVSARRGSDPRQLNRTVRGELDWIAMRALEKDRRRRYETANDFAADVARYLADQPVEACPPSGWYRLRKFARRNKAAALTTATVAAALLLGTAVATWQAVVATRAKQAAVAAAAAEKVAKDEALAREVETNAVLDFVETKVFAAARPEDQDGGLGHDVTLRKALEASLPFVDRSFVQQPLIEARLRRTLGISFSCLSEAEIAAKQLQKARSLYTRILGHDHPKALATTNDLATSYAHLGRHAEALGLREEILKLKKSRLGPDHPGTLTSIAILASSYTALGRHAEAIALYEDTLVRLRAKLGPHHPTTLICMNNLATSYFALARYAEAVSLYEKLLILQQWLHGLHHPETLRAMNNLAAIYAAVGRNAEAHDIHVEVLELQKARLGPGHRETLRSMSNVASSYAYLGRHAEAITLHEEALSLLQAKFGRDHPDTLHGMTHLASSYAAVGRHAEALKLQEETLPLQKRKLGRDHPDTLESMNNLANSYLALGRPAEALKLQEETLSLQKRKLGRDHRGTLVSMLNLAVSYKNLGRPAEALKLQEETLSLQSRKLGREQPDTLTSMNNLAATYAELGHYAEALKLQEETLSLQSRKLGREHPDTLRSMNNLAATYLALGRPAEALKLGEEALALQTRKLGRDHRNTLINMNNLASSYAAVGRHAEALKLKEEALALRSKKLGREHPDAVESTNGLAWALCTVPDLRLREPARAVELAKEAVELRPADGNLWNTLGVAHYRAGDWEAAAAALGRSIALRKGGDPNDWLILAMVRWRRGEAEEARRWHARSVAWIETNRPADHDLLGFRAEADALIGPAREMPDGLDAFAITPGDRPISRRATADR